MYGALFYFQIYELRLTPSSLVEKLPKGRIKSTESLFPRLGAAGVLPMVSSPMLQFTPSRKKWGTGSCKLSSSLNPPPQMAGQTGHNNFVENPRHMGSTKNLRTRSKATKHTFFPHENYLKQIWSFLMKGVHGETKI